MVNDGSIPIRLGQSITNWCEENLTSAPEATIDLNCEPFVITLVFTNEDDLVLFKLAFGFKTLEVSMIGLR